MSELLLQYLTCSNRCFQQLSNRLSSKGAFYVKGNTVRTLKNESKINKSSKNISNTSN